MSDIIRLENVVQMTQNNWRAVNCVSLQIREKERVMVCGGPDSGKYELMRLVAGMEKPSSGTISVLNQAVHAMSSDEAAVFRNQNIGVVLREPGFMDKLCVVENISLPLIIRGMKRHKSQKAAADLLKALDMRQVAQAYPAQLTGYEMRVAGIARALITQPRILMMAEVTSRLSERESEKMFSAICATSQYCDCTVLCLFDKADHRLYTDRTVHMENGKIQEVII